MHTEKVSNNPCGGRKPTAYLRLMNKLADEFQGLPDGFERYEIIRLLKSVGRDFGFTSTLINHLEYLLNHTQEQDWCVGQFPLVFKSISKMAVDLGVSERQVTDRENALHRLGVLTWRDCGNHKRYGHRDSEGRIVDGFGVNLAPLAALLPTLTKAHEAKLLVAEQWTALKRQISYYRKQVKQTWLELEDRKLMVEGVQTFILSSTAMIKRIRAATPVASLEKLLSELKDKLAELLKYLASKDQPVEENRAVDKTLWTQKTSARAAGLPRHKYYTYNTYLSEDKVMDRGVNTENTPQAAPGVDSLFGWLRQEDGRRGDIRSLGQIVPGQIGKGKTYDKALRVDPNTIGFQHIKLDNVVYAMAPLFKTYLKHQRYAEGWASIVDTASRVCGELTIKEGLWQDACHILGREAAAVAIVIIDANRSHPSTPIHSPGAVLHAMLVRAQSGNLSLHQSLFGILARNIGKGSI